jgi:cyclopropane-fatty-acyl-phospholipid synthase
MNDKVSALQTHLGVLPRPARMLLSILARLRCGRLEMIGPDGRSFSFPGALPGPDAVIHLEDWDVASDALRSGDIGFAQAYLCGRWGTPDLTAVLTLAALNHAALEQAIYGRWWGQILHRLTHLSRSNTRAGARRNIHAHYDIGNDFYERWLDLTMTYSSALFAGDLSCSLEDAQTAKYESILRIINPKPGELLLEIGFGWGGFAEYAARTRGCRVHGISISRRQLSRAQACIRRAGLDDQVTLELRDYRDLEGQFDHIVSIEMYEAVGERFWPGYFEAIASRLKRGGRAAIQAIVIADELFPRYRRGTDFIQQFIFPGGMLASPLVFERNARKAGLEMRKHRVFGLDYAETLKRWQQRFNHVWPEIQSQVFDTRFKRLWNFYLSYCEAGFRAGTTDVMQVELVHA